MRDKMSVKAKFYSHGMTTIFLFISATKVLRHVSYKYKYVIKTAMFYRSTILEYLLTSEIAASWIQRLSEAITVIATPVPAPLHSLH